MRELILVLALVGCGSDKDSTPTTATGAGTGTGTGAGTGTGTGAGTGTGTGAGTGTGTGAGTGTGTGTGSTTVPTETFVNPPDWVPNGGVYELRLEPVEFTVDGKRHCARGYNGGIPGPTLRVPAGTNRQVRVDFTNTFTSADNQPAAGSTYDFNRTNLHTHGLHVSPTLTTDGLFWSDNVLLHVEAADPTYEFRYDIDERVTHNPGTFWYHPHVHGSTAIQVGGGAAGAFVIEGDFDQIPAIATATERIMIFQQPPWDVATPLTAGQTCDENNLTINDFNEVAQYSQTLVNGVLEPTLVSAPGQVEHWRWIHGGVTDDMHISLYEATSADCSTWNTGSVTSLKQVAADGIALSAGFDRDDVFIAPGYRIDLMAQAPSSGTWCLVSERPGAPPNPATEELLLRWVVDTGASPTSTALPTDVALAAVSPATLDCAATTDGTQTITLDDADPSCPPLNIDCQTFDPATPRVLSVDTSDEWTIQTGRGTHPFHIHVNPFTVCEDMPGEPPAPHWRDTLIVDTTPRELHMEYPRFTGDFVLHCHKLNHEDSGMMQLVRIQ